MPPEKDMKYDQDKIRLDLVDPIFIEDVGRALTYGAKKYVAYSWRTIDDAVNRYYAAAMRHLLAYRRGEQFNEESGLSHLSHAATCLMFLVYFERQISLPEMRVKVENAAEALHDALRNPPCFGSDPSPRAQVENDCIHCKHSHQCFTGNDAPSRPVRCCPGPGRVKCKDPGRSSCVACPHSIDTFTQGN